ncbi:gamma-glutamylcyclotransferase [Nitratidesulfovibrio liaohensis]|uniref:gamma-glutamylcyclotransferase n=1 Tax=Nitratidesulfovibrio liaohensis TaxID=2604158 RepID=UPI003C798CB6
MITDPLRDLPPIDRLEGFRPGGHSMYQRVMVAVLCGRTSIPAWTYWMPCPPYAERVASGQWLRPRADVCGLIRTKAFDNRPLPKYIRRYFKLGRLRPAPPLPPLAWQENNRP